MAGKPPCSYSDAKKLGGGVTDNFNLNALQSELFELKRQSNNHQGGGGHGSGSGRGRGAGRGAVAAVEVAVPTPKRARIEDPDYVRDKISVCRVYNTPGG